jgi:hypothetical protein
MYQIFKEAPVPLLPSLILLNYSSRPLTSQHFTSSTSSIANTVNMMALGRVLLAALFAAAAVNAQIPCTPVEACQVCIYNLACVIQRLPHIVRRTDH